MLQHDGERLRPRDVFDAVGRAWAKAEQHVAENPPQTKWELQQRAARQAIALRKIDVELTPEAKRVLVVAQDQLWTRGIYFPLPLAWLVRRLDLTLHYVRRSIQELIDAEIIVVHEPGQRAANPRNRRSTIYAVHPRFAEAAESVSVFEISPRTLPRDPTMDDQMDELLRDLHRAESG